MTFGQKLGLGFAVVVGLGLIVSATALYVLKKVVAEKDLVINVHGEQLLKAQTIETATARRMAANRGYFLTGDDKYLGHRTDAVKMLEKALEEFGSSSTTPDESKVLDYIANRSKDQAKAEEEVFGMRRNNEPMDRIVEAFPKRIVPIAEDIVGQAGELKRLQQQSRDAAKQAAVDWTGLAIELVIGTAAAAILAAFLVALVLTRMLSRQIGSAVQQVQSSSSELQAAANQQTTGSKEQAASMNEISATIRELLATAKQIAESAQRVAQMAEESTAAARTGDQTVAKAQAGIGGIGRQVELIVNHMLDLGRKSQQIGGILEIINELAEQTNILAINATIEAAGVGEGGRRFAAVADEIRKLADRVGGSTKEIRSLIDEVRSAVNTTVMATETGSKAVDAGAKQFEDVTGAFRQIVESLGVTTEAAREIELSTRQQTTAVEQVTIAVTSVAQAAQESEASSRQVLQTAGELSAMSRDLARLVRAGGVNGQR